ncbi:MAG: cell wall-binding repeat-containing protein [Actinomycetota bacterium]|nr:cell wall-binding repeat-containing protein [Actinomycetota bacterium]
MLSNRGRRFLMGLAVVGLVTVLFPIAASADPETFDFVETDVATADFVESAVDVVYPITFPVVGDTYYSDTFGACRDGCSRRHTGIDIMTYGWKGLPIVAAHSGTITLTTESAGRDCCAIWGLTSDDGWKSLYIHMNNDTPGTDDGQGWGFAPGIDVGTAVEEGQLIGWVGDSGNAERVSPHLHFELHKDGVRINPYPSLRAATKIDMPRIAGDDRFHTAVAISLSAYPGGADIVYVATGYNFPDALAGGPGAVKADGPILLSRVDSIPAVTLDEIRRLSPSRIVILGGEAALAPPVADALASTGADVVRLAGRDRYDTAAMISAMHFDSGVSIAFVTGGTDFPAAVAGAPAAAASDAPMLLTRPDDLPSYTRDELKRLQPEVIMILGGSDVVGTSVEQELAAYALSGVVQRLSGDDQYATAVAISQWAQPEDSATAYVATSGTFVDALAGVSVAVRDGAPILLVGDDLAVVTADELERLGAINIVALGGPAAVVPRVAMRIWSILNNNDMPLWK